MRKVLFFCRAGAPRQVSCGLRALIRSPVSSGRAFYVLQTPRATHLSVWNRTMSIPTYFCLSIYLNIDLYLQISSQAGAESYSSPCCLQHQKITTLSFMHRAGVLPPAWFNVVSAATSLLPSAVSPSDRLYLSTVWVLVPLSTCLPPYRLSTQVHDHWMYQRSSSGTHVPQGHGGVEDWVRRACALAIGWIKGLQEARGELLAVEPMCSIIELMSTLPRLLDKADFLKSLHNHQVSDFVSQHWPYNYFPYCPSISTKTPAFLTLPCPPIPSMSSHGYEATGHGKTTLQWQQGHRSRGGWRPRSRCSQRYAGSHGKASEPQLHSLAWPANAQGEKHLRNWLGVKVKQHYRHS